MIIDKDFIKNLAERIQEESNEKPHSTIIYISKKDLSTVCSGDEGEVTFYSDELSHIFNVRLQLSNFIPGQLPHSTDKCAFIRSRDIIRFDTLSVPPAEK
ncbi:hypothetical protein D3C72_1821690 [compost metagenome]